MDAFVFGRKRIGATSPLARFSFQKIRAAHPSPVVKHLVPIVVQVLKKNAALAVTAGGDGDVDVSRAVLQVYGEYARRYYGFPSHMALRNPDGGFLLSSIEAEMRQHPDHR